MPLTQFITERVGYLTQIDGSPIAHHPITFTSNDIRNYNSCEILHYDSDGNLVNSYPNNTPYDTDGNISPLVFCSFYIEFENQYFLGSSYNTKFHRCSEPFFINDFFAPGARNLGFKTTPPNNDYALSLFPDTILPIVDDVTYKLIIDSQTFMFENDTFALRFFNRSLKPPEPQQPDYYIYKQQFQITEPVHLITYINQNELTFLTQNIKVELIRKNKPNTILFDLSKYVYENLIYEFLQFSKHSYRNIPNSILLNMFQNLYLDKDNYLLVTFYGTTQDNLQPDFKINLNHLFLNSSRPISILKSKIDSNFFQTYNYRLLYIEYYSEINSIESVTTLKNLQNNFQSRNMFLTQEYFLNTQTKILPLNETQKLKISTDNKDLYYYLIDF